MIDHNFSYYFLLAIGLLLAELFYFRVAVKFQIIDKPNERSSHLRPVIRGGGVIFFLSVIFWFLFKGGQWPWFMIGMALVSIISFLDDLRPQNAGLRFMVHLTAMLLLFYQIDLLVWPLWLILLALVICIGTINAFNFMDGINGLTGLYSLVTLMTFLYVNWESNGFALESLVISLIVALFVFLFFNFRRRAKCFAGDIGSVSLAFSLIFLLLQLIAETENFAWVLLLLVYGTDSVITIIYRILRRENIFRAHRTHLYQYFSNEMKIPHLRVSALYAIAQLIINAVVILFFKEFNVPALLFVLFFALFYTVIRELTLKKIGQQGLFMKPLAS